MMFLYKIINRLRLIYWYIFRPTTKGVKCLIEFNNHYLLIKTSYSADYWTIPGGGVHSLEIPEFAIKREIREEAGIIVDEVIYLGQYESVVEYKKDCVLLYYTIINNKDFKQNVREVSRIQWFPKNGLPLNISRALKESIALKTL